MSKIIGAYVRVSTEEQAKTGFSLDAQEEALDNYAKAFGHTIYKIYRDEGKSAKNLRRPAMQKLLKDAESGKFNAVLIYKLDRFSRSIKDLILTVEHLKKIGIDFMSVQDNIDTTSATGKFQFHLFGALAEMERGLIGERTVFGMEKKAKIGAILNRAPRGYIIKNKSLCTDFKGKKNVIDIFNTYLTWMGSLNQLAKKYQITTRGLTKLLRNKTYLGKLCFKGTWYGGEHEVIISKDLFNRVQEKLNHGKNG